MSTNEKGKTMLCPFNGMRPCKVGCGLMVEGGSGEAKGRVACAIAVLASVTANGGSEAKPIGVWFGEPRA